MKNSEWNNIRGKVHHAWLQNEYLVFLQGWAEDIDEALRDEKSIREDILKQIVVWRAKERDFILLLDETIDALSPAQLLDEYPLNRMDEEDKVWLREVVHALYLARTGMEQKVDEIRARLVKLFGMHGQLMNIIDGKSKLKRSDQPFKQFHREILEFSAMISALPHEVQVV